MAVQPSYRLEMNDIHGVVEIHRVGVDGVILEVRDNTPAAGTMELCLDLHETEGCPRSSGRCSELQRPTSLSA